MTARASLVLAVVSAVALAACSGHSASVLPSKTAPQAHGLSPALVPPAPMVKTAILPASAMRSPANRSVDSVGRTWSLIPGAALQVAAAPDGSLWALSNQPNGSDKYIWHYSNGAWQNIPGLATQIAVNPISGELYAINSGGGVWDYNNGTWTSFGGGASSIAADSSYDVYVVSNSGDGSIWRYSVPGGPWQRMAGTAASVWSTWDNNDSTALPSGAIAGGPGVFILNAAGEIWYENGDQSFGRFPGGASAIASTSNAGVYVLANVPGQTAQDIYYYNYFMPGWYQESGSGTNISSDGLTTYVVGGSGAIYQTTASPFVFGGGSESQTVPSTGATFAIPASGTYNGMSATIMWGSNNASAPFGYTVQWASGSDVPPAPFVSLPNTIGTAVVYLDWQSASTTKVSFTQTPDITAKSASFPGTSCGFAFWGNTGNGPPTWTSMTSLGFTEVTPSGGSFHIPATALPPGNSVDVHRGEDLYIALYCH